VADTSGRTRRGLQRLGHRMFDPLDWNGVSSAALELWEDFFYRHSIARAVFPWLNGQTLDVVTASTWQVVFDAMCAIAEHMDVAAVADAYRGSARAPSSLRAAKPFEYQKRALDYYATHLIDRTRTRDYVKDNQEALRAFMRMGDLPDPDAVAAAPDAEPTDAHAAAAKQEGHYAKLGFHGRGHVYAPVKLTEEPFDYDHGHLLTWMLRRDESDAERSTLHVSTDGAHDQVLAALLPFCNIHSPLVAEPDPSGRAGVAFRVTAITDYAIMYFLRNNLAAVAARFAANRETFAARMAAQRRAVFRDPADPAAITMSNGQRLRLSAEQQATLTGIADSPLTIITGGAGTGKSTLIAVLSCLLSGSTARVAELVAEADARGGSDDTPAGVGARRRRRKYRPGAWLDKTPYVLCMAYGKVVSNFTRDYGLYATTIHYASAVLNHNFWHDDRRILLNRRSPSHATVAILDELSVLSFVHLVLLFNALPRLEKIIFVGDPNQMQSIERGGVGDTLIRLYGAQPRITTRLSFNYRLTGDTSDDAQLAQRANRAFEAIVRGDDILRMPAVYGPYTDAGRAADLPAICTLPTWDPEVMRRAATRAPLLLLPHVGRAPLDPLKSLQQTMDALLDFVGRTPAAWANVQVLTQRRREETEPIVEHLTRVLFPHITLTRNGKLPFNDLYVGERVVIKERVQGFSPNGTRISIAKNDVRVIETIEDGGESVIRGESGEKTVYRACVKRVSTRQFVGGLAVSSVRKRIVRFTDGYYVVFDLGTPAACYAIDAFRRGICTTNASMQGDAADVIATYIRPGVSFTYDRTQLYTSTTRIRVLCIIVTTPDELLKIVKRAPPERHNQFDDILGTVELLPPLPPPVTEADASEDGDA
jgi:hypothetical protein